MELAGSLSRLPSGIVAVVGDVMLDHHVSGKVARVSEEAPVPVLQVRSEKYALGGAANVAANIAALGGRAHLVGVLGDDPAASHFMRVIAAYGPAISFTGRVDRTRPTVLKTRYMGGQHQIVRVDRERPAPISALTEDEIVDAIEDAVAECAVLVLSDYGKGVLTDRVLAEAFALAKAADRIVIVDPKRTSLADYRGATFITPNRKELSAAVGLPCETDDEAASAAAKAIAESGAAILLTRSEKGMTLYRAEETPIHLKAQAREVFDVSGAGDTVVATLALSLAAGIEIEPALRLANAAAGIVVGKVGTATAFPEEIASALSEGGHPGLAAPVLDREGAGALRETWRSQGLKVGFANGCFDLLHPGHIALITQAAATCDRLIMALNSDASVRRLKGPTRPAQAFAARAAVMAAIKGVDLVVGFEEDTPLELIRALVPDVLVKGKDYREEDVVGGDVVKAAGGKVLLADLTAGHSTSKLLGEGDGKE